MFIQSGPTNLFSIHEDNLTNNSERHTIQPQFLLTSNMIESNCMVEVLQDAFCFHVIKGTEKTSRNI